MNELIEKIIFELSEKEFVLTSYEKVVLDTTILGDFNVVGSTFNEVKDQVVITKELINKALVIFQKRHPFLRSYVATVDNNTRQSCLRVLSKIVDSAQMIDFEFIDLKSNTSNIIQQIELFNSKLFQVNNGLLWRCLAILYNDQMGKQMLSINLSISLIITDGINTSTLSIELINILNSLLTGVDCEETLIELEPFEHSIHDICEQNGLFGQEQKAKVHELSKITPIDFILHPKFKSNNEKGLKINFIKLDRDLTNKLSNSCKKHGVRMTGVLNTAAFYAIKQLYSENGLEPPKRYSCLMPANLRLRLQPNIEFYHMRHLVTIIFSLKSIFFISLLLWQRFVWLIFKPRQNIFWIVMISGKTPNMFMI